jgi:hypothetical protein
MVTADVETGSRETITLVANEGVGGGVEGQSAETWRVPLNGSPPLLLNSATAPRKRVLLPRGGSDLVLASGADRVLEDSDLAALRDFTGRIPGWFRNMPPEARAKAVADVEFGFIDDRLILFQIRPFVENAGARANTRLVAMDESLRSSGATEVNMNALPRSRP